AYTFKVSDIAYEVLQDQLGIRPAPYMASRGMKWLQVYADPGLSDTELKEHIKLSRDMVIAKLTRKIRSNLGLNDT
ncbi:MAG: MmcQ/YjbR family DNA-binding protein, partial [Pseudomonadota bacterium]